MSGNLLPKQQFVELHIRYRTNSTHTIQYSQAYLTYMSYTSIFSHLAGHNSRTRNNPNNANISTDTRPPRELSSRWTKLPHAWSRSPETWSSVPWPSRTRAVKKPALVTIVTGIPYLIMHTFPRRTSERPSWDTKQGSLENPNSKVFERQWLEFNSKFKKYANFKVKKLLPSTFKFY